MRQMAAMAQIHAENGVARMEQGHIDRHVGLDLYNKTETVFLFTDPKWSFLSSTMIKEVASLGGDISEWVPANVLDTVRQKYEK